MIGPACHQAMSSAEKISHDFINYVTAGCFVISRKKNAASLQKKCAPSAEVYGIPIPLEKSGANLAAPPTQQLLCEVA